MTIRAPGPGLPSDSITFKCGFDGWEQPCFLSFLNDESKRRSTRVTFALNTYYPEVSGHYFLNRQLLTLFDACLKQLGLHVVDPDCFVENGLVPAESFVRLEEGEVYSIVDDRHTIVGYTAEWCVSCGVRNKFYDDSFLIDFLFLDVDVDAFIKSMSTCANNTHVELRESIAE